VNKEFSSENCYWGTKREVQSNTTRSVLLKAEGKVQLQEVWARELGVKSKTINKARKRGMLFADFVSNRRKVAA